MPINKDSGDRANACDLESFLVKGDTFGND